MKKVIIVLLLILVAVSVFTDEPLHGTSLVPIVNGHGWIQCTYEEKAMFIVGVLRGVSYANTVFFGYDPDGIANLRIAHVAVIITYVDDIYVNKKSLDQDVVYLIALLWVAQNHY